MPDSRGIQIHTIKSICFILVSFIIFSFTVLHIHNGHSQELEGISIENQPSLVHINIPDYSIIYEGAIINCTIQGDPLEIYWTINNHTKHSTFYKTNPVLFDPEPTPIDNQHCILSVHAIYPNCTASDSVIITLHRIFFGDIHFHSSYSDGYNTVDTLYANAIKDKYVDFACLTDHAEIVNHLDHTPPQPLWMFARSFAQFICYKITDYDEWTLIKEKTNEYYYPGEFTTFLGFEYSPGPWYKGGFPWSSNGHEDIGHINFYYKDVYTDAPQYSARECPTWHEVIAKMNDENRNGHRNIAFPHHPLTRFGIWGAYTVNWSYLAENIIAHTKSNVVMGAETYSKWGQSIGKYSDIPITWPYNNITFVDKSTSWVENALWEWSKLENKNPFLLIASSDNHATDRPASASMESRISKNNPNPAGIIATYAVHNTRSELWESIANGYAYGTQLLKIRAHVTFDGECALGQWINCTSPLNITISALSTFNGTDASGKQMTPHSYSSDELDYPIEEIWIIKKDAAKGQPWCKVIAHNRPQSNLAIMSFEDSSVKQNDFYFIVIKQKGQYIKTDSDSEEKTNDYLAFLGPIFINEVK